MRSRSRIWGWGSTTDNWGVNKLVCLRPTNGTCIPDYGQMVSRWSHITDCSWPIWQEAYWRVFCTYRRLSDCERAGVLTSTPGGKDTVEKNLKACNQCTSSFMNEGILQTHTITHSRKAQQVDWKIGWGVASGTHDRVRRGVLARSRGIYARRISGKSSMVDHAAFKGSRISSKYVCRIFFLR